ncbi:MFS transporter [Auraticoccus monumenti]|uniref:MFS transporter, DHA3 family, multidrug efflux protein n=1 Tax=Auraticoccus monumenti TaxID=675864 RepID=A0A1G7APK9_9ACTN|nr:MFS transporter [Auraticoccus monumenti]SDE16799.1 MFS transporter, DHA3 family, multidrug efflux protein [Auraticoccus monumenti]
MTETTPAPRLDLRTGNGRTFLHLLANTLVVAVMNYTLWFALTFWVFIETRSVFATGMIAGIFVLATASTGVWFGSLVDHHRKVSILRASSAVSVLFYAVALAIYLLAPDGSFRTPASVWLWVFVVVVMLGVMAGNLRTIAMPTLVTLLIPEGSRDRANGLVGTTTGASFLVTSVISGLLVAAGGMYYALLLAIGLIGLSLLHLVPISVEEPELLVTHEGDAGGVDLRGTWRLVRSVPGLVALIAFSCFNNFLGGAFMALMDAYGLSLVSVQVWGLLWGGLSTGVIIGGLLVARLGLGSNPVRVLLLVNLTLWTVTMLFPLRSSIVMLSVAMFIYMLLMPFAESAEQTVLQKVVPLHRQGRVFGFAQSVEQAASPLTAFLIGPITQFAVIPWLSGDGGGARAIGGWFGTGPDRGIAFVFVLCGVLGIVATVLAFASPWYRRLADAYSRQPGGATPEEDLEAVQPPPAGTVTGQLPPPV